MLILANPASNNSSVKAPTLITIGKKKATSSMMITRSTTRNYQVELVKRTALLHRQNAIENAN